MHGMKRFSLLRRVSRALAPMLVAAAGTAATGSADAAAPASLPSPDWRDQVIYFALLDRFADGDRRNDDQHAGEFDPDDGRKWSGGDLAGVLGQLDYIAELGATSLWITPPVANQWWNERAKYGGYHGYWAVDFERIDPHYGTTADYRALADGLHARGMTLVQDVVLNHTADFFHFEGPVDPAHPEQGFRRSRDSAGLVAPTRWPFSRNDADHRRDRALGIYHWTPSIVDYGDPTQRLTYQLADLDDLDTAHPVVRRALRQAYGRWIRDVGVDAFRVDTAFYVEPELFADFLDSDDPRAPGMRRVAAAMGRDDFLAFGEGFGVEAPYGEAVSRRIAEYLEAPGHPGLPSMLDFPLYSSLGDVFQRGAASAVLADRIERRQRLFAHPGSLPTFVDNHDVDRFLANGDERGLRQALLALMTLPGIPVIYYGTEQGFTAQRASMFAAGYGSGGRDHFDRDAPLYTFLQQAIALRRGQRALTRGTPTVVARDAAGAGAVGWRMDAAGETPVLVLINSARHAVLLDRLELPLSPGAVLTPLLTLDPAVPALRADAEGQLAVTLPAGAGVAYSIQPGAVVAAPDVTAVDIDRLVDDVLQDDAVVTGRAAPGSSLRLVVDGDLDAATPVAAGRDGRWSAKVDTQSMIDPAIAHRLVAWSDDGARGAARVFRVARRWRTVLTVDDPAGDDHGPDGRYRYPSDAAFAKPSLDLRGVAVATSGASLRVTATLGDLSSAWSAPNGFDRLLLHLYIELPHRGEGSTVAPLQNTPLPQGMRWQRHLRIGGWSNALFAAEGADATHEGRALAGGAALAIDPAGSRVTLTLPAAALGHPASLSGARLWLCTWDYDAGYRPLTADGGGMSFGGGDGAREPLWMDASDVLVIP